VAKLGVEELFRAVAGSMRKHFGNDATTFWLINKQTRCLERRLFIDFPTGRGFLAKVSVARYPRSWRAIGGALARRKPTHRTRRQTCSGDPRGDLERNRSSRASLCHWWALTAP